MLDFEREEIAHENVIAPRYNRDYHEPPILKRHHEDFAAFVATHVREGDHVLDLGCGPASMWPLWRERLPRLGSMIGVDISPAMIDEARRLVPDGDFRVGTLRELPLESQSIDVVIASSVLHHVPDSVLPTALTEIARVLTEHGTLVGREPAGVRRVADQGGWLSGAVMAFRHLVCRLTNTREYGEPEIGDYHHAYDPKEFMKIVEGALTPIEFKSRHPFSFYVGRSTHPAVVKVALWFDDWMDHQGGQEFYYAAARNFYDAGDVADCVKRELEREPEYDSKQFMALLQAASRLLEEQLGPGAKRWRP
jgi:ubiquinone/menaquinone biosynthesis C-methylase UbiE